MSFVLLLRGIPGSGKTTWAKDYVRRCNGASRIVKRIAKDDLRLMFDGSHEFGNEHADFLNLVRDDAIVRCLDHHFIPVVDETFVRRADIESMRFLIDLYNTWSNRHVVVHIKEFDTPLTTCIERDRLRDAPIGEALIREYYDILQKEGPVV